MGCTVAHKTQSLRGCLSPELFFARVYKLEVVVGVTLYFVAIRMSVVSISYVYGRVYYSMYGTLYC